MIETCPLSVFNGSTTRSTVERHKSVGQVEIKPIVTRPILNRARTMNSTRALRNHLREQCDPEDFVVKVESHVTVSMERRASGYVPRGMGSVDEDPKSDIEWSTAWQDNCSKGP